MKIFVGTSGWSYDWNPNGFKWYSQYSGLNAVELNSSFYRLPFITMVRSWARNSKDMRWSIKVHRVITHTYMLKEPRAHEFFRKFLAVFEPLERLGIVDFYLFQLPPRFVASENNWERIVSIVSKYDLGWRAAVEWRHESWFKEEWIDKAKEIGITVVSVDAPNFLFYARSSPYTYIRMHGRTAWYTHYYTDQELQEVALKIKDLGGEATYVFFNNNHDMLENARRMFSILKETL
ncbi:MAG: DUF72 domain-containing protein [Thermoprotei archaeon]|nr:MAG: DUF72 domain-containing protein [Thermoprotei archaeon]